MQLLQALLLIAVMVIAFAVVARALLRRSRDGAKPPQGRFAVRSAAKSAPPEPEAPAVERRRARETLVQSAGGYADTETYESVVSRLDRAFDLFERGRISRETFHELVLIEKKSLLQHRAQALRAEPGGLPDGAEADLERAIGAVDWCIAWCESSADAESGHEVHDRLAMRHAAE